MAESTSKLRAQVAALTNVDGKGGFDIMQDEDTFKSIYDIMLGISKVWDKMTDVKQSALLELLAGKVRSNQVAALLNNMSRAEEILHTSENSAGTMEEVHARWLDSIAAKQAQLAASWENLSQTMMSSDVIKFFYDSGSNILNTIDRLIKGVGSLTPALTAVGTGVFGMMGKGNALTGVKSFGQMLGIGGSKEGVRGDFINAYNSVYNDTLDKQQALGAAVQAVGGHMNEAERFAVQYSKAQIGVGNGATIASMKLQSLKEVLKGIGTNLAVGAAMAGVSYLISMAVNAWNDYANAEERAVQAADDANAEYKDAQAQVQSLEKELENTQRQYDELAAKGPLNFADEQTKADLKEQTEELRLQLQIAKEIEAERGKVAYESNKAAWEKQYSNNTSAPAVLAGKGLSRTGAEYVEYAKQRVDNYIKTWTLPSDFENELLRSATMASIEDLHNIRSSHPTADVAGQAKKYVENGLVGNDIAGAIAIFDYLKEAEDNAIAELAKWENVSSDTAIEGSKYTAGEVKDIFIGVQKTAHSSMTSLKAAMIKEYADLSDHLDEMVLHGETNTQQYKYMYSLWDQLGQATMPIQHQEKVLNNLIKASQRGDKRFAKTYNELAKLAKTTEITADTLNDQKYDDFRAELERNGIEITNLIALLNQMREASGQAVDLSTTTASGIKDRATKLLGYRETGATIAKNTGYGRNGISEDDYQTLVDMNDLDYLKAVENSHGTIWFNQAKFNEIWSKKIVEQQAEMYDEMKRKQTEYVKQTKELNELLAQYQKARNQEEAVDLQNKIAAQVKNLDMLKQEIDMFNRLSAQMKAASSSYSKWQIAHNGPEESDDYDKALEAYKVLQEGFKSGRVGTADYQAAQEYLLGAGGNYYGSKEQRKKLERYLTKTKGKVDGWGARNFYSDLQQLNVLDADGRLTKAWSPEEIGKMVGIGPELVTQIFGEMNTFIADASKKYQLKSPTLEESAQGPDYSEYLKASKAFSDAVAAYNKDASEENLTALRKAWGEYNGIAVDNKQDFVSQQIIASNSELQTATDKNTSALTALTSVIAGLGLGNGFGVMNRDGKFVLTQNGKPYTDENGNEVVGSAEEIVAYVASMAEKNGNLITDSAQLVKSANDMLKLNNSKNRISYNENEKDREKFDVWDENGDLVGSFDTFIGAFMQAFDSIANNALKVSTEINAQAAALGIQRQMKYDVQSKQWLVYDPANPENSKPFGTPEEATVELFSEYAKSQRENAEAVAGFVKALQNKELQIDLGKGTLTNENGEVISIAQGIADAVSGSMEESGATFGQAAIDAFNAKLEAYGIEERLGIGKDGSLTFGGEKFDSAMEMFAAAAKRLSEITGEAELIENENLINDIIANSRNTNRTARYDEKRGMYVVTDNTTGEELGNYTTVAQALNDLAGVEVTALADAFAQFNGYLADAKSNLEVTIENGKTTITDTVTGKKEEVASLAEAAGAIIQNASDNLRATPEWISTLSKELGGLDDINVKVTATGEFQLIDKEGKPVGDPIANVGELLTTTLKKPLANLGTTIETLNKLVNPSGDKNGPGIGIGPNGWITRKDGVELINQQFNEALGSALTNISAKSVADAMKAVMGESFTITDEGGYKYNGNLFDTFEKLISESWDPAKVNETFTTAMKGFTDAATDDAGAFTKNQSAVESATSALHAFNAELAATSLNKMLEHTGQGGNFQAGPNNTIQYYDEMGVLRGIFSDMETAYGTKFGNFGEWVIERAEDGALKAVKHYEGEDGKHGDYEELIKDITSATIDKENKLTLNGQYALPNGGFSVNNGQLSIDANGTEITLGGVGSAAPQVDKNGVPFTQFFDARGGKLLETYGRYAYNAESGEIIKRPDTNGMLAGGQITERDVNAIIRLMDYVNAAGEHADQEAKDIVDRAKNLVDKDKTGQYYDLFGENAGKYGFTKTAKDEADRIAAEKAFYEAKRQEALRKQQAEEERAAREEGQRQLREEMKKRRADRAIEQTPVSDIDLIDKLYDLDKLVKDKKLDIGDDDAERLAYLADYLFNLPGLESEKYRTDKTIDQAREDRQAENEASTQAVIDEQGGFITGLIGKAKEAIDSVLESEAAKSVIKSAGIAADSKTQEVDNSREAMQALLDAAGQGVKDALESEAGQKLQRDAESAADTLNPLAQTVTNAVNTASNFVGSVLAGSFTAIDDWFTKDAHPLVDAKQNADATGSYDALLQLYKNRNGKARGDQTFEQLYAELNKVYEMSKLFPKDSDLFARTRGGDYNAFLSEIMYAIAQFSMLTDEQKKQFEREQQPKVDQPQYDPNKPWQYSMQPQYGGQQFLGGGELKAGPEPTAPAEEEAEHVIDEVLISHAKQLVRDAEVGDINGNVDIMNRPVVAGSKLTEAGWGEDTGDIATVYTSSSDVDDKILHVTPILPNGDVLSPDALDAYIDKITSSGMSPKEADDPANGGLGLLVWEQDIQNNIEKARDLANAFDQQLHLQQQELYSGVAPQEGGNVITELSETPVEVDVEADTSAAKSKMDTDLGSKKYTATVNVQYNDPGFTPNTGTGAIQAAASGTSNADAGTSLVDEQGAELIEHVSRGTYELGTDNGPRFTQLDKGDIVHTAEETKKIKRRRLFSRIRDAFRRGGVKGGGAFANGTKTMVPDPDKRTYQELKKVDKSKNTIADDVDAVTMAQPVKAKAGDYLVEGSGGQLTRSGSGGGSGSKKKSAGAKIKDALKWAEKFVDWIPTALDILKKKTTDYIKAAEKSVGYLAKNTELTSAIANVRSEIDLNTQAVERYKKQANDFAKRAGLSSSIVKLIQEGAIDIKQYDENTRKAIQTYQTWWDKAKGCLDTIESLNDQMYDLSKQKLDNIVTHFGNIDDQLNEQIKTFNSLVKVKEEYGQEMTRDDYLDAIRLTGDVISNLEAEQAALTDEFERQVNSGIIKVGSDDWYNYAKQIEELSSTLSDAKIDLSNLNDEVKNIAMNNLKTSIYYLDNLQTKIEGLQRLRESQGGNAEVNSYRELISNGMKQIENLQTQNEELEKQLDGLDILSEKYQEINQQIQDNEDKIMEIKASQEEWNDAVIDLKIDLLQKQNEKYQQRLDIMNALNDLEDARQRRVLMYNNETGFGYVQDEDEVEKAQDALNDQMYNLIINGLEEQKGNNNIYDNMGNQLIPVTDILAGVDFSKYYDSINRGSENSSLLTNALKSIDMAKLLEGTVGGDVKIDIGDIVLNGVNDAKELGDAIIAQLPGYLVQALYAKGS